MSQATGANSVIKISKAETTPGQLPASPAGQVFPFESESLQRKTELVRSNVIRNTRSAARPVRGRREVSGNIRTELNPFMGRQLKMGFGAVTTTGAGANKTHVFKIGQTLPYHTIEKGFTDLGKFFRYLGCKANRMGFEVNPSGMLPLDMDFLGLDRTIEATTFDVAAVNLGHVPFDAFEASIKEGGAAIATVTAFRWNLENNLDGDVYCIGGGGKRYRVPEGTAMVSGSLTALFDSDALLTKATAGTASSVEVALLRGIGDGTAGNESLKLTIDELIFEEQDPIVRDAGGVLVELPWTAYWNSGANNTSIMVELKNTQATID